MAIQFNNKLSTGGCQSQNQCLSKDGCPPGVCPDFTIRRHDTKPPLKISVEDCDGPLDVQGLVVEVNMWALAKLKYNMEVEDTYFPLADNIGFEQIMIGDIIVMDRARLPEYMLVTGFDEKQKFVRVERAYRNSTASEWPKGQKMKIFRILNAPASSELVYEDVREVDGTLTSDVLQGAYLVYEWAPEDTCLPGCYWLEFKLLKMIDAVFYLPGGNWTGETHVYDDGFFYTGDTHTDSSVKLSYDSVDDIYLIPGTTWTGEIHLYSGSYFTGATHDDGSVILNRTGIPSESDISYDDSGLAFTSSITPSFTGDDLTPADYKCVLGEGVEWVRRFPLGGEAFLIKIVNTITAEF